MAFEPFGQSEAPARGCLRAFFAGVDRLPALAIRDRIFVLAHRGARRRCSRSPSCRPPPRRPPPPPPGKDGRQEKADVKPKPVVPKPTSCGRGDPQEERPKRPKAEDHGEKPGSRAASSAARPAAPSAARRAAPPAAHRAAHRRHRRAQVPSPTSGRRESPATRARCPFAAQPGPSIACWQDLRDQQQCRPVMLGEAIRWPTRRRAGAQDRRFRPYMANAMPIPFCTIKDFEFKTL